MPRQVLPEGEMEEGRKGWTETCTSNFNMESLQAGEMTNDISEQISQTFGPTLTLMKLGGLFFGETILSKPQNSNAGKTVYLSRFYCLLVVLSLWLQVVIGLTTLFSEGFASMDLFLYLFIVVTWSVHCACNLTVCLTMLPQGQSKSGSQFSQFISSFTATATNLKGLRRKVLKSLVIAVLASLGNFAFVLLWSFHLGGVLYNFKPWNGNMAVRIIEVGVGIYTSFAWSLPVQLYYTTCLILEKMFETLKEKVTSRLDTEHSLTLKSLRQEHLRLCKVLKKGDRVFSPFLFVTVSLGGPLICVNLYQLIKITKNWSSDPNMISLFGHLFWTVCLSSILSLLCLFGNRVKEKAHSFYETLQMRYVPAQDIKEHSEVGAHPDRHQHGVSMLSFINKLVLFLAHVQGEPIGLSAGVLSVINKSFFLTLVGIIASYFAVLLTLPY